MTNKLGRQQKNVPINFLGLFQKYGNATGENRPTNLSMNLAFRLQNRLKDIKIL